MWYTQVVGYGFSILVGQLLTSMVVAKAWRRLVEEEDRVTRYRCTWGLLSPVVQKGSELDHARGDTWFTAGLSSVERALYTASWQLGKPEFIAVWVTIKAIGQWSWRKEEAKQPYLRERFLGRAMFYVFLLGNAFSILYATVGAKLIDWGGKGEWGAGLAVAMALLLGTLTVWLWAHFHPRPFAGPSNPPQYVDSSGHRENEADS